MSRPPAGSIVVVDWRGAALPAEPTRVRPAVVVEVAESSPDDYPNTLVVPLTHDEGLAHASFAELIEPTGENGADRPSWALAHHVTSVSLRRTAPAGTHVTPDQSAGIRRRIILAIGN